MRGEKMRSNSPHRCNLCLLYAFEAIAEFKLRDELEGFVFLLWSHMMGLYLKM